MDKQKELLIASIKRLLLDLDFIESLEKTNLILDSHIDFVIQCGMTRSNIQAMLDYNFSDDEVNAVKPYQTEIIIGKLET